MAMSRAQMTTQLRGNKMPAKGSNKSDKKGETVKKYQAGGMTSSPRPKMRPKDMEEEMMSKRGRGGAPVKSKRPPKPKMIGNAPGSEGTRGINPKDNYSDED
jgi:hypothetical protein